MLGTAVATFDLQLRRMIFLLLCGGEASIQSLVLDLAIKKNAPAIRRAAVSALVASRDRLDTAVIAAITPNLLVTQPAAIAVELVIIIGLCGAPADVQAAAEVLSASENRRVFLVLLTAARRDTDPRAAERLAEHLPENHPGRSWALGVDFDFHDEVLNDLGDVWAVAEVLVYLKPSNTEAT